MFRQRPQQCQSLPLFSGFEELVSLLESRVKRLHPVVVRLVHDFLPLFYWLMEVWGKVMTIRPTVTRAERPFSSGLTD